MFNLGNKEVTEATGAVVEGTKKLSMGKKVGIAAAVVGAVGTIGYGIYHAVTAKHADKEFDDFEDDEYEGYEGYDGDAEERSSETKE